MKAPVPKHNKTSPETTHDLSSLKKCLIKIRQTPWSSPKQNQNSIRTRSPSSIKETKTVEEQDANIHCQSQTRTSIHPSS